MRLRPACLAFLFSASAACSSGDFSVAEEVDSGGIDTGSDLDSGSNLDSGSTSDGSTDTGCAPLGANPDTIYVDARASGGAIGSAACPVRSIREALSIVASLPSAKRTVKVAGGTGGEPVVYNETSALVVKAQTSIVGDGPERVTVTGGGPAGPAQAVFVLEGKTSLEGITVIAGDKVGIAMMPAAFTVATVRSTTVTKAKGTTNVAVLVTGAGAAELGPAFRAEKNQTAGVWVEDIFALHVIATGSVPNAFNENGAGIVVQKGTLNFDGGEVNKNVGVGITLNATPKHNITGLVARDNGGAGITIENGAGLKLRNSTLLTNRFGLVVKFGLVADLDLGAADGGKNVFGGSLERNYRAAICFQQAKNVKIPATGNKFSSCPPLATVLTDGVSCDAPPSAYADVLFYPFGTDPGPPLDTTGCTVGP